MPPIVASIASASTFVVVDLETTGLSPLHNRVLEVCALRIVGGAVSARFHALVEPEGSIPPDITRLTGISRDTLAGARPFGAIAADLLSFLGTSPLVAHNAPFDYSFLREEFRRLGIAYSAPTLCTARLGRRLIPGLRRANLDSLLAALDMPERAGHRADHDAFVTASAFLRLLPLAERAGAETVTQLARLQTAAGAGPSADLAVRIRQLPAAPGVYLFRNSAGQVIYVGKGNNLRRRVQSHFRPGAREPHRLRRVIASVETIDQVETGSELEALIRESQLIKQFLPAGNAMQRDYQQYPYLRLGVGEPFPRLSVTRELRADGAAYYGPFRRSGPVEAAVGVLQDRFHLPRCTGPINPGVTPMCIYGQMGRCVAPCAGQAQAERFPAVVADVQSFLSGRDGEFISVLERRRDELAEELRFEQAAELRDAADELRHLFGAQWRLSAALSDCHAIILAPSLEPGAVELFVIRGGLLAAQRRVRPESAPVADLEQWLTTLFADLPPASGVSVRNDQLDELHIIAGWLRRDEDRRLTIPVNPENAALAAAPLADAILGFDLLTAQQAPD